jgi:hypothetical protein
MGDKDPRLLDQMGSLPIQLFAEECLYNISRVTGTVCSIQYAYDAYCRESKPVLPALRPSSSDPVQFGGQRGIHRSDASKVRLQDGTWHI